MVDAFRSVGSTHFGISVIDDVSDLPVRGRQLTQAHINEIRFRMPKILADADQEHWSVILRPSAPPGMMFAQLDDLNEAKVEVLKRYALVAVRTSPGNLQQWIAFTGGPLTKEAQRDFALRLNRSVGADFRASRAGRIAGSMNYKPKHGPTFPEVEIVYLCNGCTVACSEMESAGLVAAPPSRPAQSVASGPAPRGLWPGYQWVLDRAPMRNDGSGRDRSVADAFWCKLAAKRSHSEPEIAAELCRVSAKAQEELARGNTNYATAAARWGVKKAMEE